AAAAPPPAPAALRAPRAGRGAASPDAAPALPTAAELPPEIRRQLPSLSLGGSVWSEDAANRFVLLNGEVVREGQAVAPGLVLERLLPREAQFSFQGTRWRMVW
ncbi:general secretion pathway protein GspB, partial [Ideonella livida]